MYLERKYRGKSSAMLGNVMAILTNLRNISATTLQIQLSQLQKMGTVFSTIVFVLVVSFGLFHGSVLETPDETEAKMPTLLARLFTYDNHSDDVRIASA